jgi:hypothetical protein
VWFFSRFGITIGVGFLSAIISTTVDAVVLLTAIKPAKQVESAVAAL